MKSYTPVYRFGHALLVPTIVGKDPARLFLIDTGGFMNMISVTTAREVTKVHEDSLGVKGLSGTVNKMYSTDEIKRKRPKWTVLLSVHESVKWTLRLMWD